MKPPLFLVLLLPAIVISTSADDGFRPIFNGKDLAGWDGNPALWSVEEGCITGKTTKPQELPYNQFLIWRGGTVKNFELRAKIRQTGNNTGIQYRSKELPDVGQWSVGGYQCDIHPTLKNNGMVYEEKGRGIIVQNGQSVVIDPDGKRWVVAERAPVKVEIAEWHDYTVIAQGNHLIHKIDGQVTIDLVDHDGKARALEGLLAFQIHRGPVMNVQIKDVMLKELPEGGVMAFDKAALPAGSKGIEPRAPKKSGTAEPTKPAENAAPEVAPPAPEESAKPKPRGRKKAKAAESLAEADTTPPAAAKGATVKLKAAPGFKVETIYEVPLAEQSSWVALTIDDQGRLLASDQGAKGLFRITLPDAAGKAARVEKMPVALSGAQGLAWQNGSLYFFKNGEGLFRVSDADGDDRLEKTEMLSPIAMSGEHGSHGVIPAGDGAHLFAMAGNHTPLPAQDTIVGKRPQSWQEDLLLPRQWDPRGHARGVLAPGGWFTRFDPAKKTHEVFCVGFRNQYDAALNVHGDLFTYDSDMEWDMGLPWYRPTRICHVVSGGDFGWRSGSGNSPAYYEDNLPPVLDIGPGSPTGVVFGTGAKFSAKYQHAMYALDWTYGRILAIHLQPQGASYQAVSEVFVSGAPLPVTDAVIGKDGALYFTIGGRGAQSALMRVTYTGGESTEPAPAVSLPKEALTRRELEAFHGVVKANAVDAAWPHLSSPDRFLRNAARVAIESQPVATWAERVLAEKDTQARITAAVALARSGSPGHRERLLKHLLALDFASLPTMQKLGVLRAISLTFDRLGKPTEPERAAVIAALDPLLPGDDFNVNADLLRLLVYLNAPSAVPKGMSLIANTTEPAPQNWDTLKEANARYRANLQRISKNPPPTQRIRFAFTLRTAGKGWTPELRRQYFAFLNEAGQGSGGASYPGYLSNIREEALTLCTDAERLALKDIVGRDFNPVPDFPVTPPKRPGRAWTLPEAVAATDTKTLKKANWESGRSLFHAIGCGACHRFNGLGGGVGPDLTSVPNKFDTRYLLESIIEPSKVISDQYGSSVVTLNDGRALSGLVVEQGENAIRIYPADIKAQGELIQHTEVKTIAQSPVSQMPPGLIHSLSERELRDLVAYIMSGGNPRKNFSP